MNQLCKRFGRSLGGKRDVFMLISFSAHTHTHTQVEEHVSDALSKGGEVVVGGGRALSLGNCFFQPSVLVGANTDMQLAHEETFGPVAPIIRCGNYKTLLFIAMEEQLRRKRYIAGGKKKSYLTLSSLSTVRFEREAEAIAVANATPFGLAGLVLN